MAGARTFRRAAEIEMRIIERESNIASVPTDSVWHNADLEPPRASIGNAVNWRPSAALADAEAAAAQKATQARNRRQPSANAAEMAENDEVARPIVHRIQVCSCCSQIRVLGHVRVCAHTNKSCSRSLSKIASQLNYAPMD